MTLERAAWYLLPAVAVGLALQGWAVPALLVYGIFLVVAHYEPTIEIEEEDDEELD